MTPGAICLICSFVCDLESGVLYKSRSPPTLKSGGSDVIGVSLKLRSPSTLRPDGSDVIGVSLKLRPPPTLRPDGNDTIGVPDNSRSPLPHPSCIVGFSFG